MRTLCEALYQRVLLADGSIAAQLARRELDLDRDLFGATGVTEVLNLTRAALMRGLYQSYVGAGSDIIRPHTMRASPLTLAEYGLGEDAFSINYMAARLSCEAIDSLPGLGRRRFVLGVIRDLGWDARPKDIENAVAIQAEGLLAGGVDGIALDLLPDADRARTLLRGVKRAREATNASAALLVWHDQSDLGFSESRCAIFDGQIRLGHGSLDSSKWLAPAIRHERVNLIAGGEFASDTAILDKMLRDEAEDLLRPLTVGSMQDQEEETPPPASLVTPIVRLINA